MEIRKSTEQDIPAILDIYDIARSYMRAHGNTTQWGDGYPGREVLERDIREANSYVMFENGKIVGTIHRLASNGTTKGIARACFDFCTGLTDYVRIDTHKNNLSMQTAILRYGFRQCGNIYVRDGSERIAYDYEM